MTKVGSKTILSFPNYVNLKFCLAIVITLKNSAEVLNSDGSPMCKLQGNLE